MTLSVAIFAVCCALMILSVLFKPQIRVFHHQLDLYWVIVSLGALLFIVSGQAELSAVVDGLVADSAINPIKILVLFLSMTLLSIFLDELGFFSYLAGVVIRRAKTAQMRLFLYLYLTVSVLTVFTSNDIIILSFTPFICFFSKSAGVSPVPYLAAEFIAANTWSMALIIGNPTNIYLAGTYDIGFAEYLRVMLLPTVAAGTVAFLVLYAIFKKRLSAPINPSFEEVKIKDKTLLTVGIAHLAICTFFLAVGYYINVEMWLVSLCAVISLFAWVALISLFRRTKPYELGHCLKRAPWQLVPFITSMFVMILALSQQGVTDEISRLLGAENVVLKYGITSFLSADIINNIPMSVLFCEVIEPLTGADRIAAVYATVIGSNIGAFLTPIGALAGIMWTSMLKERRIKFGYGDFIKIGATVSVPTILTAFGVLALEI